MFLVFRLDWQTVLFIVCFMCKIVDIVPVSTKQPLGVDQEQLFEEEEYFAVVEEGKWSSPPAYSILSYITAL
jgi:hypothetical protein